MSAAEKMEANVARVEAQKRERRRQRLWLGVIIASATSLGFFMSTLSDGIARWLSAPAGYPALALAWISLGGLSTQPTGWSALSPDRTSDAFRGGFCYRGAPGSMRGTSRPLPARPALRKPSAA